MPAIIVNTKAFVRTNKGYIKSKHKQNNIGGVVMGILHLTKETFAEKVLNEGGLAVVDFWADWCGPCKMFSPIFEKAANDCTKDAKFFKINIDEAEEIADKYKVMSIPTVVLFKDGEPIRTNVGLAGKAKLIELINLAKN